MPHKTTNAERCRTYKERVAQDPILLQELKEKNKEAARRYRQKQKTTEQLTHQKQLQRERQKRYEDKKKARALQAGETPRPQTRLDHEKRQNKKDSVRIAVQKHRANQTSQKKRRVNEKRMAYYYRKKEEARSLDQAKQEKAVQAEFAFQSSGSPYPNQDAFKRAVRRVRQKIKAKGKKFAFLFKGLVKMADKTTKEALEDLNVRVKTPQKNALNSLHEHISSIKSKRDKDTLSHKRRLAEAFLGSETEAVFNRTYLKSDKVSSAYSRQKESKIQQDIREFFDKNASEDPCKVSKKKQLTQPVRELHKEFILQTKSKVSLRSFHRHKPKNIASVKKLKFRQCLCEICLNPKLKITRLNAFLNQKCESVRELLNESVCDFEDVPQLSCVDRKCSKCGVAKIGRRLREDLGMSLGKRVGWSRWELVKEGKSSRMEKVKKNGSIGHCLSELLQELGPLCRHVFNAEWQRKQLQLLKSQLPDGWAMATCDFAENFLCRQQFEPQSAHWAYKQVTVFPVVVFSRCPEAGCEELRRDSLVFFCDDLRHDAHVTQAFVQHVLKYMSSLFTLQKVVLVSDGCAAQFKSKLPFLYLSHTPQLSGSSVEVEKVFFGSRHGKNDSDWCGGAVKRAVTRDIAGGKVNIKNARDMYEHCCKTLAVPSIAGECQHKAQAFFLVEEHDINRKASSSLVATVPGSRKLHHLRALSPGVLATRQLACFCPSCLSGQYQLCHSSDHVDDWEVVKLKYRGAASLLACSGLETEPQVSNCEEEVMPSDSSSESDSSVDVPELDSERESPVVSDSESLVSVTSESCVFPVDSVSDSEPDVAVTGEEKICDLDTDMLVLNTEPDIVAMDEKRISFFETVAVELAAGSNVNDIKNVSKCFLKQLHSFPLPDPALCSPIGSPIDSYASRLLEPEVRDRAFPLSVDGDGNCFYRALSLLVFGTQNYHKELRCRIVMSMACNQDMFLDGENWCGEHDCVTPDEVIRIAVVSSVAPEASPFDAFQREVLSVRENACFAGLWELFAASIVLNRPIQSVFPELGWDLYRLHCNRIIRAPGCVTDHKLFIMWSSLRLDGGSEHWAPNHFVPLVLKRPNALVPKRGSFRMIRWNRKDYVCQVKETDELLEVAFVSFLCKQRATGYQFWPVQADTSWEPFTSLKGEVSLRFVEEVSSQRCQFFEVI